MGPIALILVVLVLPILAGVVVAAVAGLAYAFHWLAGAPLVTWAPSLVAVVAGYAGGRVIGKRRRRDAEIELLG